MKAAVENKFAAILQSRHEPAVIEPEPVVVKQVPQRQRPTIAPATVETPRRVGRPAGKGKRCDPAFRQVTAYVPQELHSNATIALRLANQVRVDADKEDFSELLTRLLADWYEKQTYYRPGK